MLTKLPYELINEIIAYLDLISYNNLKLTSKMFNGVVISNKESNNKTQLHKQLIESECIKSKTFYPFDTDICYNQQLFLSIEKNITTYFSLLNNMKIEICMGGNSILKYMLLENNVLNNCYNQELLHTDTHYIFKLHFLQDDFIICQSIPHDIKIIVENMHPNWNIDIYPILSYNLNHTERLNYCNCERDSFLLQFGNDYTINNNNITCHFSGITRFLMIYGSEDLDIDHIAMLINRVNRYPIILINSFSYANKKIYLYSLTSEIKRVDDIIKLKSINKRNWITTDHGNCGVNNISGGSEDGVNLSMIYDVIINYSSNNPDDKIKLVYLHDNILRFKMGLCNVFLL